METQKKRCPKGTRKNKLGECVEMKNKTQKNKTTPSKISTQSPVTDLNKEIKISNKISAKDIELIVNELLEDKTIKVPKISISYLLKKVTQKSPDELRRISKENELYMQLEQYSDDKEMLLYLVKEILELAINGTRDNKKKSVTSKMIERVIDNDEEFKLLLL